MFQSMLESRKITVSVRQTRGLDASAACGQLQDEFQKSPLLTPSNIDMQSESEGSHLNLNSNKSQNQRQWLLVNNR